jgi:hypothetical protein
MDAPVTELNVPAAHDVQVVDPADAYLPTGHAAQVDEPAVPLEVPAKQDVHWEPPAEEA